MKTLSTWLLAWVVSGVAVANTTNFEQGAGNTVGANPEETFQALIDSCGDVSILGLRARARLEMNQSTPEDKGKIAELMDQAMATCGGGDIEKATEQMNEAIALGKASVTENFGTDASVPVVEAPEAAAEEGSGIPMAAIIGGVVVLVGIGVMMRRKKTDDDDE